MSTAPCRLPQYWVEDDEHSTSHFGEGYFYRRLGPVGITHVPYEIVRFTTGHISLAQSMVDEMTGLDADWEALGSEAPNTAARGLAVQVLDKVLLMGIRTPSAVTASAEGGIGIIFRSEGHYAALECLNDGEIWMLWYDEAENPHSRPVANTPEAIQAALRDITAIHADA